MPLVMVLARFHVETEFLRPLTPIQYVDLTRRIVPLDQRFAPAARLERERRRRLLR
jgi:hypothetical protein